MDEQAGRWAAFTEAELDLIQSGLSGHVVSILSAANDPEHEIARDQAAADVAADMLEVASGLVYGIDDHLGRQRPTDEQMRTAILAVRSPLAHSEAA